MAQKAASRPRLIQAMIDAFSLPDLRKRLLITFGILVVFRFMAHVPVPGVDAAVLQVYLGSNPLLGMLDLFSGGALQNFSLAAMGVYPYITASIIITLMTPVLPPLQRLAGEGESGRKRISAITHWLMIPLAGLQGYAQLTLLRNAGAIASGDMLATVAIVLSLIAGSMFLVWLGEQITQYGIGNGISIIIFAGIMASLPTQIGQGYFVGQEGEIAGLIVFVILALVTAYAIVIFTEAHRRIPVQYAKSVFRGGRMYRQSGASHIPMRVNTAGMIPLIFSMAMVTFPGVIAQWFGGSMNGTGIASGIYRTFSPGTPLPQGLVYWGLYFLLVVGFAFFYTTVIFQQQDLPNVLQRQGGFVPGIRPGKQTSEYLNGVIMRITWAGALFLAIIAIVPFMAQLVTPGVAQVITLSSSGMLISVGVVLDTMKQMEAQLAMRRYEGFLK
ncbi:MAG: preprotein translocase subunit SecY [Dehalococcoidia bacterium]|nr:preprotein translocase subunit SecY [Dehalococcoidia bacterium]